MKHPIVEGEKYFIAGCTMSIIGRATSEIDFLGVWFEKCCWVNDLGSFEVALDTGEVSRVQRLATPGGRWWFPMSAIAGGLGVWSKELPWDKLDREQGQTASVSAITPGDTEDAASDGD